jgi:hypothetical protein
LRLLRRGRSMLLVWYLAVWFGLVLMIGNFRDGWYYQEDSRPCWNW